MIRLFALFLSFFMLSSPYAKDATIIWGQGHLYSIKAPKNWVMDTKAAKASHLQAVMYPNGGSWEKSETVIYTNVLPLADKSVEALVKRTLTRAKKNSPNVDLKDAGSANINGRKIILKKWLNVQNHQELVAYAKEKSVLIIMVLSAKTTEQLNNFQASFDELVKSYRFYSSAPEFKAVQDSKMKLLIAKTGGSSADQKKVAQILKEPVKKAMELCKKEVEKPSSFDVVFHINKFGLSTQTYWSENDTAYCFMTKGILSWIFPKPKGRAFYYHLKVTP